MKSTSAIRIGALLSWAVLMLLPQTRLFAQQDKVAVVKQALADNRQRLRQYQWIETTMLSLKGEEKSLIQKQCSYAPNGWVQRNEIGATPQEEAPGGLRGKVVKKKKGEITEYMERAAVLITQYVPPEADRTNAAKEAGAISIAPGSR